MKCALTVSNRSCAADFAIRARVIVFQGGYGGVSGGADGFGDRVSEVRWYVRHRFQESDCRKCMKVLDSCE